MSNTILCPVCRNADGGPCCMVSTGDRDSSGFKCDVCGEYEISGTALAGQLDLEHARLTPIQRAGISHRLRTATRENPLFMITTNWLDQYLKSDRYLPTPAVQATNIIRFFGNEVSRSGKRVNGLPVEFHAIIGAPNRELAGELVKELLARGLLNGKDASTMRGPDFLDINLTLTGWEKYDAEKRGKIAGKYGFIAMKFHTPDLDPFVNDVVKPTVKDGIGYDLVDMRNVARAGIIDNIMRNEIRNSAFVIVDLTHDNSGAYWEAGYAEGLGKPVIYICEREKFEQLNTHFDTNHCTTVLWSQDNPDHFSRELIATLRRSLNLFPVGE